MNKNSIGYKIGQIIGCVFAACFTAVTSAFIIAIAVKLIQVMCGWIF